MELEGSQSKSCHNIGIITEKQNIMYYLENMYWDIELSKITIYQKNH